MRHEKPKKKALSRICSGSMNKPIKITSDGRLIDALNALSQVPKNENGRIFWASDKLDEGTFGLIYSLKFNPPIDDYIKDGALWHVLNECARESNFSTKFFLQRLRAFIKAHLSKTQKTFVAVSQVNCNHSANMPKKLPSIFGQIEFAQSLSRLHQAVINKLSAHERSRLGLQNDFIYLTTKIKATDDRSAVDIAYRNIKFCLGVLNLVCNGFGVSKRFGYPHAPIGKFLSASSIFTIDRSRRKLGGYLSENHFPLLFKINFSVWQRLEIAEISKFARYYVSDVGRTDFSEKIVQAIILFQEGLETAHIDIALLKFWTGIELLCAKETKEPTERVVERASSIFVNPKHAAMRLNFIQKFRDRIVHQGDVGGHSVLCAQWGSIYLSHVIRFFLFNKYKLRKHSEVLDYLSTPLDQDKLVETIALHRKRLKMLRQ